jgi:hypothetical protein
MYYSAIAQAPGEVRISPFRYLICQVVIGLTFYYLKYGVKSCAYSSQFGLLNVSFEMITFHYFRTQSQTSDYGDDGALAELEEGQEGFICPVCKRVFVAPVELQAHFETAHSSEASMSAAKKSEGNFHDLKVKINSWDTDLGPDSPKLTAVLTAV